MAATRPSPVPRAAVCLLALLAACADPSAAADAATATTDAVDAAGTAAAPGADAPDANLPGEVAAPPLDATSAATDAVSDASADTAADSGGGSSTDAIGDDAAAADTTATAAGDVEAAGDLAAASDGDAAGDSATGSPADAGADAALALGALNHPLQTAADLVQLVDLHQVVGSGMRQVIQRQVQFGDALCPGKPTLTLGTYQTTFSQACTISKGGYQVDLAGAWTETYTDPCQKLSHQLYSLSTDGVSIKGKEDAAPVDVQFAPGGAVNVDASEGGLSYTWSGTSVWHQLPTAWLPTTAALLSGHTISGAQVQRAGDKQSGAKLTGWLAVDGLGAQFDTPTPLQWLDVPNCFVPSSGQLRLIGAATAVITFAPGPACAPPTWTRDGVPMGEVKPTFWGWLVLCGSAG